MFLVFFLFNGYRKVKVRELVRGCSEIDDSLRVNKNVGFSQQFAKYGEAKTLTDQTDCIRRSKS